MPLYEFRYADGTPTEAYYSVAECPAIGDCVEIDGKAAIRVLSIPRMSCVDVGHEAVSMHSLRHGVDPDVPRYSPEGVRGLLGGFPLFKNKAEIKEYEAKKAAKGSNVRYDP